MLLNIIFKLKVYFILIDIHETYCVTIIFLTKTNSTLIKCNFYYTTPHNLQLLFVNIVF